jgi:hypothetical protein
VIKLVVQVRVFDQEAQTMRRLDGPNFQFQ